ncbi:G2/mitotic-specific cyclin 2 [Nematocida parisii]|uniref:Cell division cycle protein Cdc13 n=1 Tax=Nematocida parisii (strain ERTm3) TaxID=935791 RepID=I3EI36_NEMP3
MKVKSSLERMETKKMKRKALAEIQNNPDRIVRGFFEPEQEKEDPKSIKPYTKDILLHYTKEESKYMPSPDYMSSQEEIKWAMRTVLIDWIIDVHYKLNLLPETLYLSVNLIDRFLTRRVVSIGKLQLVGVAGLLISSKFEEVASPSVETFVVLTDRSFTENEILRAEKYMLHCLDYKISYPSPLNWLRQCSQDEEVEKLATVILDSTLPEEAFLVYTPSIIGSSAAYIARDVLYGNSDDFNEFHRFTPHDLGDLSSCICEVKKYLEKPILHSSIFKKHSTSLTKHLSIRRSK